MIKAVFLLAVLFAFQASAAVCNPPLTDEENDLMKNFIKCSHFNILKFDNGSVQPREFAKILINSWCADEVELLSSAGDLALDRSCGYKYGDLEKTQSIDHLKNGLQDIVASSVIELRAAKENKND